MMTGATPIRFALAAVLLAPASVRAAAAQEPQLRVDTTVSTEPMPGAVIRRAPNLEIVAGALAASGADGDLSPFVDDGTEADRMGMKAMALTKADFAPPENCASPVSKAEEIRPKMVLISWFCSGSFSGVRKTALIGEHKIVALLGDVSKDSK